MPKPFFFCELSFIWFKMRTAAQETVPHIVQRKCSPQYIILFLLDENLVSSCSVQGLWVRWVSC